MSVKDEIHMQQDLYEVLGVSRNASQEEIKKNYNELVLLHHPDKGGDTKKFKDLQIAYKILTNEKNRKLYTDSLAATFTEITSNYRDEKTGRAQAMSYEVCEHDFARATTEEEKKRKHAEFMNKFDTLRDPQETELFTQMRKNVETKSSELPTSKLPTYEQLLRQQEEPVVVDGSLIEKFDVNLFNQLFEKNKQSQCQDLEPYATIEGHGRTDLAAVNNVSVFVPGSDLDFGTYKTLTIVDKSNINLSSDVTRTRDKIYDNLDNLLENCWGQRLADDCLILKDPPPTPTEVSSLDTHPSSYQQMGLNAK
jgi:curved DNA-binding protein CbpA